MKNNYSSPADVTCNDRNAKDSFAAKMALSGPCFDDQETYRSEMYKDIEFGAEKPRRKVREDWGKVCIVKGASGEEKLEEVARERFDASTSPDFIKSFLRRSSIHRKHERLCFRWNGKMYMC